ncbi:DUF4105 domain-containing protein [Hyphococcus luteus]|nr:DUF4105 domain-containing protein [Marinicaulis flavus]
MMKIALALIAGLLVLGLLTVALRTPRGDRNWEKGLSRTPAFETLSKGRWRLHDLRAFEFAADGEVKQAWRDKIIDANDLEAIWFFVEPFPSYEGAAHTLVSFVFGGETDETIAISVEARKEEGEVYSGFNGLFNKFELIYLWSTEKDVLTRIAVGLNHEIYAYRLGVETPAAREILKHFIARTNALAGKPRFYNTLTSNCTNELVKAVNSALPDTLPWHYSHVLTGYSAERLHALGFLGETKASFEGMKTQAAAGGAVRAAAGAPAGAFSDLWREKIGAENHLTP